MKAKPTTRPGDIAHYAKAQPPKQAAVCATLRREIEAALPAATSKIWHAIPVWFIGDQPVVGYKATPKHVTLLFWNGQAFGEPELEPVGKFKAAQIQFTEVSEITRPTLRRWLQAAATAIWDHPGARKASR